jgi:hypothetical protein
MQNYTGCAAHFKQLQNYFSNPDNHFALILPSAAQACRYPSVVGTVLGRADRCTGEFRARAKRGLAASVEPEGAGQDKDSNPLRV